MRIQLSVTMLLALAPATLANTTTVTLQDRQQAACYNDVQALCGDFIPDVDKTTECMAKKRTQVSPGCAKYYTSAKP